MPAQLAVGALGRADRHGEEGGRSLTELDNVVVFTIHDNAQASHGGCIVSGVGTNTVLQR